MEHVIRCNRTPDGKSSMQDIVNIVFKLMEHVYHKSFQQSVPLSSAPSWPVTSVSKRSWEVKKEARLRPHKHLAKRGENRS